MINELVIDEPEEQSEDEKILETARERMAQAIAFEADNRREMVEDVRFARLADQWPQYAKNDRNQPGKERPMLVSNRLLQYRDRIVNEIRQNTPSIRIRPATSGADQETAEVLMGLIHHIQDNSNASVAYDTAVEWQVDAGRGYIRVRNDWAHEKSFDQEIFIDRIPDPLKVYYDPYSKAPDGSDAKWALIVEEIPKKEFQRDYPDVPLVNYDEMGNGDQMMGWFNQDSVRLAEYFWLEPEKTYLVDPEDQERVRETFINKCMWVKMTGNAIIERTEIPTKYIPIVPVLGHEVWLEGKRYLSGLVRNAKDAQRLYNYYLSANAENVALAPKAPFIGAAGSFETDPNWSRANKDALAYLEYDPVTIAGNLAPAPHRSEPPQPSPAIMQAIDQAGQDIMQSMGIYQPSIGDQSNETSGRALLLRQKQAEIGNFHYQDNLSRSIRQVGRIVVDMIPKVYTRARVIRILGEDGNTREVNIDPSLPAASQNTDNPGVDSIYNPSVGIYDVVCDSGPSYATKRDEAANMMLALTQANPQLFNMIGDLMMKNMDWPGAEEIAKRLQAMLPPQFQKGAQGEKVDPQIIQAQMMMEQLAGQMEQMSQELSYLRDERILAIQDKEREWFEAETRRMEASAKVGALDERVQTLVQATIQQILAQGLQEMPEEQMEFEQAEERAMQTGPKPAGSAPGAPPPPANAAPATGQPARPSRPGAMTRKPNTEALTGQTKPEDKL